MTLAHWLTALLDSVQELSQTALGWEMVRSPQSPTAVPLGTMGGFVALVGEELSAQIGVTASRVGCQQLCKVLLAMSPEDPDLEEHELVDAACELANIVAGGLKGRLAAQGCERLGLGLPLFVSGPVQLASGQRMELAIAHLGPVPAQVVLIHPFACHGRPATSDA
jgi:CheY-specific phosphatase CheX